MSLLFIHLVNSKFESRDDGEEYGRPEAALQAGIRGALGVAADEVLAGRPNSAVELIVEQKDGTPVFRSLVTIAVSPLLSMGNNR